VSVHDLETEATAQAINSAMEAGLLVRCPLHHAEFVAVGGEEAVPASIPANVRARVRELMTSHPKACPRCAEESE
jgi:nitrite reductase/ring-hydroxylating ferredoxin subunit